MPLDYFLNMSLRQLIDEEHLVATIDISGQAFHFVHTATVHTGNREKIILWLTPEGYDDDLTTVMVGHDVEGGE